MGGFYGICKQGVRLQIYIKNIILESLQFYPIFTMFPPKQWDLLPLYKNLYKWQRKTLGVEIEVGSCKTDKLKFFTQALEQFHISVPYLFCTLTAIVLLTIVVCLILAVYWVFLAINVYLINTNILNLCQRPKHNSKMKTFQWINLFPK